MAYEINFVDSSGGGSYDAGTQYVMTYTVHNPDGPIGPNAACNAVNWNYGNTYNNIHENDSDSRAVCVDIQCDSHSTDDGRTRTVSVTFRMLTNEERDKSENPFAVVKESFKVMQDGELALVYDANNQPIVNRAYDRITDITEARYTGLYKLTVNYAFPPAFIVYFVGKCNGDYFRGFPPRTLKLVDIDEIQAEFSTDWGTYYPLGLSFAFDPQYHMKRVINEGYRAFNDENKLEHIMVDGEKTTEPMFLTWQGKKAPAGSAPTWLQFETQYALPFNMLVT